MDKVKPPPKMINSLEEVPIKPQLFKSLSSRCRVSCVKFLDNYILAGVGDVLHIYNSNSQQLEFKKQILKGQNIYGITFLNGTANVPDKTIIWGGKELCIATVTLTAPANVSNTDVWLDSVWIWDVLWLDSKSFVSIGMNNSVTLWNCCSKSKEYIAYCEDQCILYSGRIIGNSWNSCVVLAGTVMQNILIWKPDNLVCRTLHSLKGHKGAVFSVNYCRESNLIVSTSDDRSVRIWKVIFRTNNDWATADIPLISSIFGHTARVWNSVILHSLNYRKIISIGEDGLLCAWTESGENIMRREAHQGGSICSVDANLSAGLIITGGVDGGLCQWSVENHRDVEAKYISFDVSSHLTSTSETDNNTKSKTLFNCDNKSVIFSDNFSQNNEKFSSASNFNSSTTAPSNIPITDGFDANNFSLEGSVKVQTRELDVFGCSDTFKSSNLKSLILIKTGNIVASLDRGVLLGCSPNKLKWTLLFYDVRFTNYHLLSVSSSRKFVSLASICGTILVFQDDSSETAIKLTLISEVQACTSKIFSLHWLSDNFFITCISEGLLGIWNVTTTNGVTTIKKHQECVLPSSKERWLTCASLSGSYLLCGDRIGSIHHYNLEASLNTYQTFKRIHNGGVCDVKWNDRKGEAYSIGRDGYLRHWIIKDGNLELLLTEKLPIKWPTRIFLNHPLGTIVHGFTASQVLIWSYCERKILLTQDCGGGHRSWDCTLDKTLVLVWIKDKCVQFRSYPLDNFSKSVLLEGFHCKEINALTTCESFSKDGRCFTFLLTGSEDTTLRVSSCPSHDSLAELSFIEQSVFRSHISSIRALASVPWASQNGTPELPSEYNRYLVVSTGGRAQLKVWSFTTSGSKIDKMVELASHMLRGDDKSRRSGKCDSVDPEARYMAVDIVHLPHNLAYIFTACSDAIIRIFQFNTSLKTVSLEAEIDYHEACVLGICVKEIGKNEQNRDFEFLMLTMTTEGNVAVWKIEVQRPETCKSSSSYTIRNLSEPVFEFSAHQSGVNSHALTSIDSSFLLATGGDDTAITLSCFNLQEKSLKEHLKFDNAHEAQVSGILFHSSNPWILSTSTDQRIILWAYEHSPNLSLQYVAEYQSIVADIHGLKFLDRNESIVCVFGCGLEVISFESEKVKDTLSKTSTNETFCNKDI